MAGRFLLDTNIVIALLRGDDTILQRLQEQDEFFLSSIVLGELYFGALKSSNMQENLARIDELASICAIVDCDALTAREYGQIKKTLREKGKPIPENDIWIAAAARRFDLTLITRDEHFQEIEQLVREAW